MFWNKCALVQPKWDGCPGTSQQCRGGLSPGLWSVGTRPWPAAVIRDIRVTVDHELDLVKYFAGSTRLKLFCLSRLLGGDGLPGEVRAQTGM